MKSILFSYLLAIYILNTNGSIFHSKKPKVTTDDYRVLAAVKIYSNFAEIIQPLGKLPLEFSSEDWSNIRADSITLVGTNVNVTQQTITEQKKTLNNVQVYVRTPSSSNTSPKFLRATVIDEKRYLVKLIDKDISKDPIFTYVSSNDIVYDNEPAQTKYYVNFTYDTTDAVYLSYLRSNLNWKTRYQLNLFENSKNPILIAMADIRNDGESKVDIEEAELLGGDINLQMYAAYRVSENTYMSRDYGYAAMAVPGAAGPPSPPSIKPGEELAGLYVFAINQPFSIDAKTNYLLPMFRPQVTVERYYSFSNSLYTSGNSKGKAQRSYRLSSDRFLSSGNCIIRETDRLVGETSLPDIAAKDKHEFSIGQDSDVIFNETITVVSTRNFTEGIRLGSRDLFQRTETIYNVNVAFRNFKKNRPVKVEYQQRVYGQTVKLGKPNTSFTQDGSIIKGTFTLAADDEKSFQYRVEVIN